MLAKVREGSRAIC